MQDFWENVLGSLAGTIFAFFLGIFWDRHTNKTNQIKRTKQLKNDIVRHVQIITTTELNSAYYSSNYDRISTLLDDIITQHDVIESSNNALDDELRSSVKDVQLVSQIQHAWFDFRNQYIHKFLIACNNYQKLSSDVDVKKAGQILNGAKINLDRKAEAYLDSLKFIDRL